MRQMQQANYIQQQPQQHGGFSPLGTLFSLISAMFPNPITPVASAVMNPSAGNIANAATGVAGMLGGGSNANPGADVPNKPFVGPMQENGGPQQSDPNKPQYQQQGPPAPQQPGQGGGPGGGYGVAGNEGQGNMPQDPNAQSQQQAPGAMPAGYGGKTLDEIMTLHPELQHMFPMMLSQLGGQGGMM